MAESDLALGGVISVRHKEQYMDEGFSAGISAEAEAILTLENAPFLLVIASPDGTIRMANRALRDCLGYGPGDLIGQEVWLLSADASAARQGWLIALAAGETPERPVELRHRDGAVIRARGASIVVVGANGEPRLVICRGVAA